MFLFSFSHRKYIKFIVLTISEYTVQKRQVCCIVVQPTSRTLSACKTEGLGRILRGNGAHCFMRLGNFSYESLPDHWTQKHRLHVMTQTSHLTLGRNLLTCCLGFCNSDIQRSCTIWTCAVIEVWLKGCSAESFYSSDSLSSHSKSEHFNVLVRFEMLVCNLNRSDFSTMIMLRNNWSWG